MNCPHFDSKRSTPLSLHWHLLQVTLLYIDGGGGVHCQITKIILSCNMMLEKT